MDNLAISASVGGRERSGAGLSPSLGVRGISAWMQTPYASWQRNRCRRAMNRLANAQVTSKRWVFFFSPR
jgi:hypothetical protein